jgi:UDP-N-acetylmuramoyl-L-alanyl-D-glutamate--2,6-diaminopimelate ligase
MKNYKYRYLKSLLAAWEAAVANTDQPHPPAYFGPDVLLTGFVEHTDDVLPGKCFVARVRTGTDGHPYIGQAVAKGASLIIGQKPAETLKVDLGDTPYLQVSNSAIAEAWLAASWFDFPARQLVVIGVTGTDGKTTTANLIFSILGAANFKTGLLSTLRAAFGDIEEPLALHVTTPEAPVIQEHLRRMVDSGLTHCILETTSHGLAQHRVDAIDFDLAVVTNITHEHLDYHGDYEGYLAAKSKLFEGLTHKTINVKTKNPFKVNIQKTAVLNRDDSSFKHLLDLSSAKNLTYGLVNKADITARNVVYETEKTEFRLELNQGASLNVKTPLIGQFNIYNILAAAGASYSLAVQPSDIRSGIEAVENLTGRMERIDQGQDFLVVVDFAHTPNALEKTIAAVRNMTDGRVITVFGSAGKRDVVKRRLMAEVSTRKADLTILTAEDPRTESLEIILDMMVDGCRRQGGIEGLTFIRIPDRGQAIYHALTHAQAGDVVLICGKGHEQSMCFGAIEYPWDDVQATQTALTAFLNDQPMPDLGLPTFRNGE